MESHTGNIMILSNSIIGVSILAMPFCFKQCGIILAILMLLISSIITRLTCHFLLKSAIMARRRTFELLAFHTFGTTGKFIVELGIIGFLMGTCIAFFVIIGDLGPAIIAKMMGKTPTDTLRTSVLIGVALFCVLPLGLLKNVDSLHSVSTATIGFYCCLILKTISESAAHFASGNWLKNVEMWRPIGILQCLPIFAMALSCQTQLFEIYETVANPTLDKMNYIVRIAINICVCVYVCVGFFGYAAFASEPFTGNILMSFNPSSVTDAMKIGFILSVAFSFPLVIFPCRASLHSLLFKKGYAPYEGTSNFIPESKFKILTVLIVGTSLGIGIMIPNIEVVLGLVGSTIGTMICMIFPVTCFICISTKNTNERLIAQFLLFIGVIVMVLGTYANLYAMEQINDPIIIEKPAVPDLNNNILKIAENENIKKHLDKIVNLNNDAAKIVKESEIKPEKIQDKVEEVRLEPPQPVEPVEEVKKIVEPVIIPDKKQNIPDKLPPENTNNNKISENVETEIQNKLKNLLTHTEKVTINNNINNKKLDEVDIEAIRKEDNELKEEEKNKQKSEEKTKEDNLMKTIEHHKEEQKKLMEEQKELIQEHKETLEKLKEQKIENEVEKEVRRKAADKILEIAKKAIEELAPDNIKKETVLKPNIDNKNKENKLEEKNLPNNKTLENIQKETLMTKNKIVPLPMAINKTINDIYNINKKDMITNSTKQQPIIDPVIQIINNEIKAQNISKAKENTKTAQVNEKLPETKKIEESNNLNPAKRDILTNNDPTETNSRIKREAEEKNCEATEKNKITKTKSPVIKLMTETLKTENINLESINVINTIKMQLKPDSVHIKRK